MKKIIALTILAFTLAACAHPGQNNYYQGEVGQATEVEFGTILSERQVDITGNNTGAGATAGALGGAAAGAGIGHNGVGILAGILIGAVAGSIAEQEAANHVGIEYTIILKNRKTISIVQNQNADDEVFAPGAHVMVQTSGGYKRVLSAENLPEAVKKPKSVHIVKEAKNPAYEPDQEEEIDPNN